MTADFEKMLRRQKLEDCEPLRKEIVDVALRIGTIIGGPQHVTAIVASAVELIQAAQKAALDLGATP